MTSSELLEQLLAVRGISDPVEKDRFLNPEYAGMHDPFLMHDIERAIVRIFSAIENNERICIYSDYDADGIPGAVILHDFFKKIGYENFSNYIPHRHTEGYGLHMDALTTIASQGTTLMITVDLGITAVNEVVYARELGMEIIITDHHEPLEKIPDAFAVVNPKLGNYPDRMLCGAGVAFKVVQGMIQKIQETNTTIFAPFENRSEQSERKIQTEVQNYFEKFVPQEIPEGWEKWLLDMAGLATLSDMVPLQNENRIIAYFGMKVLMQTKRPGLRALFEKSGIDVRHLVEDDITFSITPRLNAASRMAHPEDAFNLLATTDPKQGIISAEHLSALNDERKKIVATIMRDVHTRVKARIADNNLQELLVIGDPKWSPGILGLVASKIVEEYECTTFVWGAEGETIKGSVRGIGDASVVDLMQSVTELLVQFGGHADAGGFSATREQIHFLEEALCKSYRVMKNKKSEDPISLVVTHELRGASSSEQLKIKYDLKLELNDVTMDHYYALRKLAPFGVGNEKPIFAFDGIVHEVRQFGKTKEHLEVVVSSLPLDSDTASSNTRVSRKIKAISWFSHADSFTEKIETGKQILLLATFDHSVFRGKQELRLKIVDVLDHSNK